ncbi:hypothetical protein C367_02005 [Cryptococcus neoformans Ze90-1]|nr:hypothetical protein C367_02005 [Cryptococcus neoformans var. grubii Ze90-1]
MVPSTLSTSKSSDSVAHNTIPVPESSSLRTMSTGNYNNSYPDTPELGISRTDVNVDNSEGPEVVVNKIFNSDSKVETHSEPSALKYEVRLFGLSQAVASDHLFNFFAAHTKVLGILMHATPNSSANLQWAQVWVPSEADVVRCLGLKECLVPSGITLVRAPLTNPAQAQGISAATTPELKTANASFELKTPPTPLPVPPTAFRSAYNADCTFSNPSPFAIGSSVHNMGSASVPISTTGFNISGLSDSFLSLNLGMNLRDNSGLGYRHVDPQGPLPRNLYVMGLPLDMTQIQFKALFTSFGMVEHSTLLSQLDGMGRRRGFVLMSTHQEAVETMRAMNGTWHGGFKMDVSWALVQREAKHFGSSNIMPNRVVHPPTVPIRRESVEEGTVVVDNLDSAYFPDSASIRDIFNHFGPVSRVNILSSNPFKILIQFDHAVSATALVAANGLNLGGRPLVARRYVGAINTLVPTLNSATAGLPQSTPMTMPVAKTAVDRSGQQFRPTQYQTRSHAQHSLSFSLQDLASPPSRMTVRRGNEPLGLGPSLSDLQSLPQFETHQSDPSQSLALSALSYKARSQSQPVSNQQFQQPQQSGIMQTQSWRQFSPFTAFMEPTRGMDTNHGSGLDAKPMGNSLIPNSSSNGKGNDRSASSESKPFGANTLKSDLFAPLPWHPVGDNKRTISVALKEINNSNSLQDVPHQQQSQLGLNKTATKTGLGVQGENKPPITNATGSMAPVGSTADLGLGGLGVRGMQDRWQVSPDW